MVLMHQRRIEKYSVYLNINKGAVTKQPLNTRKAVS